MTELFNVSSAELEYFLRKLVQPSGDARFADEKIVADPAIGALGDVGGMRREHHIPAYAHGFIKAHQRALDHVVALAVAVQAFFLGPAMLAHVLVIGFPDVLARGAGLEQAGGELLRLDDEGELVFHFLRGLAEYAGAAKLGIKAAGSVVLAVRSN